MDRSVILTSEWFKWVDVDEWVNGLMRVSEWVDVIDWLIDSMSECVGELSEWMSAWEWVDVGWWVDERVSGCD